MVRFLVHHATTVILAVLVVFVFGLVSYLGLPRESAPDVEIPVVIVSTPYVGVSPADVESLVTIPLENELASLTDVKRMNSSSAEGVSIVSIEFEPEVDIDDALQKVRDRVNKAGPKLPDDAEQPSVSEVSFDDVPIMLVTIAGIGDEQALKKLAEDLEEEVTRIPGVLEAEVTGGRDREIRVQVLPQRLAHYGLSMNDVVSAIERENVNIPGGDVVAGRASVLLRTPGEFSSPDDIERVAIKRVGDRPVFVSDVARVVDTFEDRTTYSRMRGETSVTLSVKKRAGTNMLDLADAVRAKVAEQAADWPDGVVYEVLGDQSENVANMVSELQNNIITALLLVVGVLFVFMGARNSLFVAVAIPLSMLVSFLVLDMLGFTLNMVVLFSLILALGMLVDNAIVVVENVYRHMEMGKDHLTAAIDGTNEVAMAVAASTATTVAAFFPMVFWSGIMGQFMGYLPKTVIIVLTASLVVAIGILPVLTSRLMSVPADATPHDPDEDDRPVDRAELGPVMARYLDVLRWSLRHRYLTVAAGVASLVVSVIAYGFLSHGVEFFPATAPDRAVVSVRLPEGTDLEATDRAVRGIETILTQVDNIENFVAEVGVSGGGNPLAGAMASPNEARVTVDFLPSADKAEPGETLRIENTFLTMAKMRAAFSQLPGIEIAVEAQEMGPPVGDPIAVEVSGKDFDVVGEAAFQLMREIAKIDGTTELKTDYRVGRPELRLRVDRGAAKRVGVSTQEIGGAVRTAIAGSKASALRDGEDEYDIVVEVAPEWKTDLQRILDLRIPGREDTSPSTFPVPLSAVASYELAGGAGTIKHVDQDVTVTITGDVERADQEAMIREEVSAFLATWDGPPGIGTRMGGAAEEQEAAVAFLAWAFALAVALIMMVLVAQFDSIALPAIIIFTVLLSLVGVLWGLILTGTSFVIMMTGIGIISLAGVVVNNAIVLLDYVQQLEAKGLPSDEALLRAGITRFRPVMLTAVTTALGLIPMAIGASIDFTKFSLILGSSSAQFWGPMAVAVIFGLSFATLLTLVMVPTLYAIWMEVRERLQAMWSRRGHGATATAKVLLPALLPLALLAPSVAQAEVLTLKAAMAAAEENNLQLRLVREKTLQAKTLKWQALSSVMPKLVANGSFVVNEYEVTFGGQEIDFDVPPFPEPPDLNIPFFGIPPEIQDYLDELTDFGNSFADIGDSFSDLSQETVVQPKTNFSADFTVQQPILNGQAFPAWQGAKRVYRAALADEARAVRQVRGAVAQAYYGLRSARESVAVSQANKGLAEQQLELATRQVAAGYADELAKMQAEVAIYRAERDVLQSKEQLVQAEQAFARVTGLRSVGELADPPLVEVPQDLEDAVTTARSDRQDVVAASLRVEAARNERTGRDLEWLPSIDLTFSELYNQNATFGLPNWQWRLAINLNWTIWDGGYRIARSRELASKSRAAQLAVEDLRNDIEEEVRTLWMRLSRAEEALEVVTQEEAVASEALRRAETRASAGKANWLDVEVARTQLQAARLGVVVERANRDLAAVQLLVAMGRYEG